MVLKPGSCNSCGEKYACKTFNFFKLWEVGHIQRVCRSCLISVVQSSAEFLNSSQQSTHFTDPTQQSPANTVVIALSHSPEEIPPMLQILQLPQLGKRLCLMVDSSPVTFINTATWNDLNQPPLTSTHRQLNASEGQ